MSLQKFPTKTLQSIISTLAKKMTITSSSSCFGFFFCALQFISQFLSMLDKLIFNELSQNFPLTCMRHIYYNLTMQAVYQAIEFKLTTFHLQTCYAIARRRLRLRAVTSIYLQSRKYSLRKYNTKCQLDVQRPPIKTMFTQTTRVSRQLTADNIIPSNSCFEILILIECLPKLLAFLSNVDTLIFKSMSIAVYISY